MPAGMGFAAFMALLLASGCPSMQAPRTGAFKGGAAAARENNRNRILRAVRDPGSARPTNPGHHERRRTGPGNAAGDEGREHEAVTDFPGLLVAVHLVLLRDHERVVFEQRRRAQASQRLSS